MNAWKARVTVHRWAIKVLPGQWKYLYRAVDHAGDAVDFLLPAKRDLAAARQFLERAINLHDVPGVAPTRPPLKASRPTPASTS